MSMQLQPNREILCAITLMSNINSIHTSLRWKLVSSEKKARRSSLISNCYWIYSQLLACGFFKLQCTHLYILANVGDLFRWPDANWNVTFPSHGTISYVFGCTGRIWGWRCIQLIGTQSTIPVYDIACVEFSDGKYGDVFGAYIYNSDNLYVMEDLSSILI